MGQRSLTKTMWRFLKSKKLSQVLIAIMAVVFVGQVLMLARVWDPSSPQVRIQSSAIYSSWWFTILAGAMLVNLLACTGNNLFYRLKAGSKNWSTWGSTIFHAGLALVIIGTLITGHYRIFCSIKLIEGEPKSIPYQALLTEATTGFDANDRFTITLKDQTTAADTGMSPRILSQVELVGDVTKRVDTTVTDSQQLAYRSIYMFPRMYGYAVRMVVLSGSGERLAEQTVPIDTEEQSGGSKEYSSSNIVLKPLEDKFSFTYFPDPVKPTLLITLPGESTPVALGVGQSLDYKGMGILLQEVKPWTELMTAYDPGAKVVFAGIVLALLGQIIAVFSGKSAGGRSAAAKRAATMI
ncbi:MAG TPA: hypothetical protein VHS59_07205 [Bacillota bacterium]|nr:hypothetical protein [Bacillota bacterium]